MAQKPKLDAEGKPVLDAEGNPVMEDEGTKPKTVEMSQEDIDRLIDQAFARGARKGESGNAEKLTELQSKADELEKLQGFLEAAKASGNTGDASELEAKIAQLTTGFEEKLDAMQAKLTETEAGRAQDQTKFYRSDLERQVIAAAAKAGAHEPSDVFVLMDSRGIFKHIEEGEETAWRVVTPDGKVRIDVEAKGEPMAVAKAVEEYVGENAHLKRGSGRQGSGKGNGTDHDVPAPKDMDVENLTPSQVFARGREILGHVGSGGRVGTIGTHNQG